MLPRGLKRNLLRRRSQDRNLIEPLLVLGDGRSGTTLLMQLLGTSPQIAFDRLYPFENRYLTYLVRWASLLGEKWQPDGDWDAVKAFEPPGGVVGPLPFQDTPLWDGQELWPRCFAAAWREFSDALLMPSMKQCEAAVLYYAEKSPFWMPQYLRQAMPFKAIVLVRDPRDVFLSINAFNRKRGISGFNRFDEDDDWTFARRFTRSYKKNFKTLLEEAAASYGTMVKYEQLAINLEEETERLGQWLGVTLDARTVEKKRSNYDYHMTSKNPGESVARWRREMSPELAEFFRDEIGQELLQLGYDV